MVDSHVRRHLLAKITSKKGNDLDFFCRLAYVIIKNVPVKTTSELMYELFAEIDVLNALEFAELSMTFGLDKSSNKNLTKDQFHFLI